MQYFLTDTRRGCPNITKSRELDGFIWPVRKDIVDCVKPTCNSVALAFQELPSWLTQQLLQFMKLIGHLTDRNMTDEAKHAVVTGETRGGGKAERILQAERVCGWGLRQNRGVRPSEQGHCGQRQL